LEKELLKIFQQGVESFEVLEGLKVLKVKKTMVKEVKNGIFSYFKALFTNLTLLTL
jgi:hypothetical protein